MVAACASIRYTSSLRIPAGCCVLNGRDMDPKSRERRELYDARPGVAGKTAKISPPHRAALVEAAENRIFPDAKNPPPEVHANSTMS
jgi:hypothetical protein